MIRKKSSGFSLMAQTRPKFDDTVAVIGIKPATPKQAKRSPTVQLMQRSFSTDPKNLVNFTFGKDARQFSVAENSPIKTGLEPVFHQRGKAVSSQHSPKERERPVPSHGPISPTCNSLESSREKDYRNNRL